MQNYQEKPMRKIEVAANGVHNFELARKTATQRALAFLDEPMLLSWFDATTGRRFPDVDCCGDECNPAWKIYGQNRGGELWVEVDGTYGFIFREGSLEASTK